MANTSTVNWPMFTADGTTAIIGASAQSMTMFTATGTADATVILYIWTKAPDYVAPPPPPPDPGGGGEEPPPPDPIEEEEDEQTPPVAITGYIGRSYARITELWDATGRARTGGQNAESTSELRWPMFRATGTGFTGEVGSSAVTWPMFTADGLSAHRAHGDSAVWWPMYYAEGTAFESATNYDGLSVNTAMLGQTTIAGWTFNALAYLNGRIIGTTDTALLEVTGDDDDGEPIDASLTTHTSEFGTSTRKRVADVLAGYRCDGDLMFTATVNEHDEHSYVMEHVGHDELTTGRVKIGRGLDGRYWSFGVENIDGCDFELDTIEIRAVDLSRKTG